MYDELQLAHYRFRFRTLDDLYLPTVNKGNPLRGAFGFAFKRLVCTTPGGCHPRCREPESCPYGRIFEPVPPRGASRLSANSDIPRPFVFRPPLTTRQLFPRGGDLEFGLVLFGRAVEAFPYFAVSLANVGREGLGRTRTPLELRSVRAVAPAGAAVEVYDPAENRFRNFASLFGAAELMRDGASAESQPGETEPGPERLRLDFVSPTVLKAEGRIVERPRFDHVIKRLRDRVNALAGFHGEGPLKIDYRAMGEASERVATVAADLRWANRTRRSWKSGKRHPMGGFIGKVTFEGELKPFLPLLALGEYTHVGKYAVWGNGRYRLVVSA